MANTDSPSTAQGRPGERPLIYSTDIDPSTGKRYIDAPEYGRDARTLKLAEKPNIADIDFTQEPFKQATFAEVKTSRLWINLKNSRDPTGIIPIVKTFLMTPVYFHQFVRQSLVSDWQRYGYG